MVVASVRQQYGLRIQSQEFHEMSWDEFSDLVSGLNEDTSLVRIAQIRTETDREAIKRFSKEQRAIHDEWQRKKAFRRSQDEVTSFLEDIQKAMQQLFGSN